MSLFCGISGAKCKKIKGPCAHERVLMLLSILLLAGLDIKYLFHWL